MALWRMAEDMGKVPEKSETDTQIAMRLTCWHGSRTNSRCAD